MDTKIAIEVAGGRTEGYAFYWIMAIYEAMPEEQQASVRAEVRRRTQERKESGRWN